MLQLTAYKLMAICDAQGLNLVSAVDGISRSATCQSKAHHSAEQGLKCMLCTGFSWGVNQSAVTAFWSPPMLRLQSKPPPTACLQRGIVCSLRPKSCTCVFVHQTNWYIHMIIKIKLLHFPCALVILMYHMKSQTAVCIEQKPP